MGQLSDHVSRRHVLASGGVLLTGTIGLSIARQTSSSRSSNGSRLLVENPTNRPHLFSLSVSNRPISAYRVTNEHGETKSVESGGDGFGFPFTMRATRIEPETNTIFDREYTVEADSALSLLLKGMPERGELLYTLKPKLAHETTFVSTWGTMGCSSRFDIHLSPTETRSSCGSRLSDFDRFDAGKEYTITL
ncbi:hypothetical protein [Haladaptatus sp. NG-SE-30]